MTKLDNTQALTDRGCRIFPIVEGSEKPAYKSGITGASGDTEKIKRYFEKNPDSNYAVACGGDTKIVVLVVRKPEGLPPLRNLVKNHGRLPRTLRVDNRTEYHFYFQANDPIPPGRLIIDEGIQLFGEGESVIGPGSTTPRGEFRFAPNSGPNVAKLPSWILDNRRPRLEESGNPEIIRLARLSKLDYERERAEAAKRLGCRVTALDILVQEAKDKAEDGKSLPVPEVDPWPQSVDGVELLDALTQAARRYVVLRKNDARTVALWVVHTYALDASDISPRLSITSPFKQCGKSTLLDVLSMLVHRPLPTANVTAAAVFRTVETYRPTLLIDEADTFLTKNDELRGILNTGHRRNTAYVLRADGDNNFEPRSFSTWAPAAIAAIGSLPETLEDRSVRVVLRRRRKDEKVTRFRLDRTDDLSRLGRMCARWVADTLSGLKAADPKIPSVLVNREADNWRPLLAIADMAGGEWPTLARETAEQTVILGRRSEQSVQIRLLRDIRKIFEDKQVQRMCSADLVTELVRLEGRPWAEWQGNKGISQNAVARQLADFDIAPFEMRIDGRVLRGYQIEQFADAFARYL
jgi:putative DNA primase/helicase